MSIKESLVVIGDMYDDILGGGNGHSIEETKQAVEMYSKSERFHEDFIYWSESTPEEIGKAMITNSAVWSALRNTLYAIASAVKEA